MCEERITTMNKAQFDAVCETAKRAAVMHTAADTLEWDERTGMPHKAGAYRAEQVAALRSEVHRIRTDSEYGDALAELEAGLDDLDPRSDTASTVRELHRDYERNRRLPADLVRTLALATVRGQQAWDAAKKANSFSQFREPLAEILKLKREQAACLQVDSDRTLYECLLEEYEPGGCEQQLRETFAQLREPLVALIAAIQQSDRQPDLSSVQGPYSLDSQRVLSRHVCEAIGFDFERGRLDETSHPFCTTLGPDDIRILTRFDKHWLASGLFGSLHEAGHGMYEQGLRADWFGLPPGSYASLGVHESQSRLWENQVGRSREFWQWLLPQAGQMLGEPLKSTDLDEIHHAVNAVRPSLIRVEADEATYNLHIIIRFDLECDLIEGRLQVDELPDAWNARYESDLGIRPTGDADGVLQDVHWGAGLIGYFPTYTLGNLVSAQLYESAQHQISDLDDQIAKGEFSALLEWLQNNVHRHGRCHDSDSLVRAVSGQGISHEPLVNYLKSKLENLYGI